MATGDPFSETQTREISVAITRATRQTGLVFSVFIGPADGAVRPYAERLHTALGPDAPRAVLVHVAPEERQVEVVLGEESRHRLSDRDCSLAVLTMTSSFAGGDLVGGVLNGVRMLAEHAGVGAGAR